MKKQLGEEGKGSGARYSPEGSCPLFLGTFCLFLAGGNLRGDLRGGFQ